MYKLPSDAKGDIADLSYPRILSGIRRIFVPVSGLRKNFTVHLIDLEKLHSKSKKLGILKIPLCFFSVRIVYWLVHNFMDDRSTIFSWTASYGAENHGHMI